MLRGLAGNLRYAAGIGAFLRNTVSVDEARETVKQSLAGRETSFLRLLERGVYANPRSPYLALLRHAGFEQADVAGLVRDQGVEGTLGRLYDAGVYVSYEEFRGRVPIRRGSLELTPGPTDFDSPFLRRTYGSRSSGSRGPSRRTQVDLDNLAYDAALVACLFDAHDVRDSPVAVWRPTPPDSSGLNAMFRYAKVGHTPERWFSQGRFRWSAEGVRAALLLNFTLIATRFYGRPFPRPQFVPRDRADAVARWLAAKKTQGAPGYLDTSASGLTRVAIAAREAGLDIAGSVFRTGGEPLTPAKAEVIRSAGARVIERYSMAETSMIGLGCADPVQLDDLHIATGKVAVIQRDKQWSGGGTVPALVYTTLRPSCPKLLLNMESGDFGRLEARDCGCSLGALGLRTHLTGLQGYDKLTSEGVNFMGSELYKLVEEVLPQRFGGYPTDYQLVEEEEEGLTRVSIVVAPGVGTVDESAVVSTVLQVLERYYRGGPLMADQWRQGNTLRVLRREPYASGGRKVLPLFTLDSSRTRD